MSRFLALALTLVLCPVALGQDDKVYRSVTTEQLEGMLTKLKIDYKKKDSKTPDTFYYDFTRLKSTVRLYYYAGKDLMLDVVFRELSLESLNKWNVKAKFTRVCRHQDDKGGFTTLESNLDLVGGVTSGAIEQFLKNFENDLLAFQSFVNADDDVILPVVTSEKLESILKGLNLPFKKQAMKNSETSFVYDFESKNFKLRLSNFNGKDLMLDAVFKKVPLEKANQYNFDRKFIRVVVYGQGEQEFTQLEANFDCSAGVSEGMVRHFITTFDDEVKAFAEFVAKLN